MQRILAMLCLSSLATLALAEGSFYSMEVNVEPYGSGQPNAYVCKAVIIDLNTGSPVMMPTLSFLSDTKGPAGTLSTKDGDTEFAFSIGVDSKTSKTTAELKVTRAGKLVAEQKTSIAVRP